jgi:hypothetical protein
MGAARSIIARSVARAAAGAWLKAAGSTEHEDSRQDTMRLHSGLARAARHCPVGWTRSSHGRLTMRHRGQRNGSRAANVRTPPGVDRDLGQRFGHLEVDFWVVLDLWEETSHRRCPPLDGLLWRQGRSWSSSNPDALLYYSEMF